MQGRAAVIAALLGSLAQAQPVAAGGAVGIQALNGSAGKGMHQGLLRARATREKHGVNERDSDPIGLMSQEEYPQLVGVGEREATKPPERSERSDEAEDLGCGVNRSEILIGVGLSGRRIRGDGLPLRFEIRDLFFHVGDGLLLVVNLCLLVFQLAGAVAVGCIVGLAVIRL